MTAEDFRRIALSLEGAEEGSHMGSPDFRIGAGFLRLLPRNNTGTETSCSRQTTRRNSWLRRRMSFCRLPAGGEEWERHTFGSTKRRRMYWTALYEQPGGCE